MNITDVDSNFLYNLTEKANGLLELKRRRGRVGKSSFLVPDYPVRMCMAEVEAVLEALDAMGVYTPPMYERKETNDVRKM